MDNTSQRRKLWGRSLSRPLSPRQQTIFHQGCEELVIKTKENELFWNEYDTYTLEIGFGDGEHFIEKAKANPHVGFLGCERFINGMAKAMEAVYEHKLQNIRLFPDDIHLILNAIPSHIFSCLYVLFPDPWPKKKHKKRRLLNRDFIQHCHRILRPKGKLCIASDIEDYRQFVEEEMAHSQNFFTKKENAVAPLTKYGRKAQKEGRTSIMLVFEKKEKPSYENPE